MFRGRLWARAEAAAGLAFDRFLGEFRAGGLRFAVPPDLTTRAFRARFALNLYELPERVLLRRLPWEGTVLELGGCLGVIACLVNRRLSDPTRHVVLEANPALLPWLHRNRDANGAGFAVVQGVLARGPAERTFWPGGNIVAGSAHRPRDNAITVPALSLEALEAAQGLSFDVFVLDIEGGEAEFIAENATALGRARAVLVEFHPTFIGEAACEAARAGLAGAGLVRRARFANAELWLRR